MTGGSRIFDIRGGQGKAAPEEELVLSDPAPPETPESTYEVDEWEGEESLERFGWVVPTLGALVSVAWVAAMLWLSWPSLVIAAPIALTSFIAALCVPPALIGILLLLRLRTSTAEARRFGNTAQAMRAEAASLERTIAVLSRTIDANRDRLAEQTTALMAMGDGAANKLTMIGTGLTAQVAAADAHASTLAEAATIAHAKLDVLMAMLPRAHSETVEMTKVLERTGLSATEFAAALDAQLTALAERGREADAVAGGAAQRLAAHIARMEATGETAGTRLEQVTGSMSEAVDGLLGRTADAVDEARKGITAQGEALLAMLGTNQAALDRAGQDGAEALAARMSTIEALIDRIAARLDEQRGTSDEIITVLDTGITHVSDRLDILHSQGVDRSQMLAASISALGGSANAMTEALRAGDVMALGVITRTEHLLTALDAAAREIDETMPDALARLDARVADSRRVVGEAKPELLALVTAAESTHDAIEAIAHVISGQRDTVEKLSGTLLETLTSGQIKADALGQMVDDTIGRTHRFAEEAAPRLVEALLRVRDTASAAADRARETLASVIPEAAQALETASAEAMQRASGQALQQQIAAIGEAADMAAEVAQRASERLTRQMLAIADSTAMVESRIEDARAERENADQDTFARRVSLLIESLNSVSIDITKSVSAEVSDSSWAAYLKGDRGVFTRRAVRLLDAGEAREILRHYDEDPVFREQVNRYIHDFEAMLRAILAQRDGSPLGVTLLSSDMGKLYVALAQAIERLRT
ncbi:hypothetical protein G4G27_10000 [Sphingomonas sp. So64.6b]|uniref:hypothetical protein n=1 Tax=Sphingomonas sp. So64.6b TaxID=2997354 RepID=UPI001600171A|nr:hypothetical protein [Sphingomonas sp. So64.6b]QNA84282.1 hypothetical protein G4G27_10000 [Sphingomonas sp. So64.6b]